MKIGRGERRGGEENKVGERGGGRERESHEKEKYL